MPDPTVSVIIPVHNGARYLAEALASVRAQTRSPFEVVVIDDGSTDDSLALARRWSAVTVVTQPNRGVAAARNAGIAVASGTHVAFLDQDDRWVPEKLDIQMRRLAERPELGFVLGLQRIFLEEGSQRPAWLRPEHLERDQVGYLPGTLIVRRDELDRVGTFDEADPIASDSDWFLRAADADVAMEIVPRVVLERRIHNANQSSAVSAGHSQLLAAVRRSITRKRSDGRPTGSGS